MNLNQLFNMFTRIVARRARNWAISKGMSTLSGKQTGLGRGQGSRLATWPARCARLAG